jgi:hypothetical protein
MQKTIGILAVLLAAQLALAVGMSFTGPNLAAQRPDTPLLDLGGRDVDHITIEGPDSQQVELVRQDEAWVLPETGNFPADTARVEQLLARLEGLQRGLAVATTPGAQQRFRVSDAAFERRVSLERGEEHLATLHFGSSPGVRRVYARTSRDDAIYTTAFGIHELPVKAADWEDKGLLQIPQDEIESIALAEFTLKRASHNPANGKAAADSGGTSAGATWTSGDLQEDETLNQANAGALAQQLATLRFGSVLGREAQPGYGLEEPALSFDVQRKGGEAIQYRLGRREGEDDYVLKLSSRSEYFRLPDYAAEALIRATGRDQLVSGGAGEAAGAAPPLPAPVKGGDS